MVRDTDQLVLGRAEVERGEKDASFCATHSVLGEMSVSLRAALARTRRVAWNAGGLVSTRMALAAECMAGWVAARRGTRDMWMTNRVGAAHSPSP